MDEKLGHLSTTAGFNGERRGRDRAAVLDLLYAFRDYAVAREQTAGNHPHGVDELACLYRANGDLVVGSHYGDAGRSLQLRYGALRDEQCPLQDLGYGAYLGVLPRPQDISGVRECTGNPDGSGLLIHLSIGEKNAAVARVGAAVREYQLQRDRRGARQQIHRLGANLAGNPQVFFSADRKICLDGVNLGYAGEHGGRRNEIADLDLRDAGNSADERAHLREAQIQFRLLNRGTVGRYACFRGHLCLHVALELAARNGICLGLRDIAFDVQRGVAELRFCLRELGFRLVQHGLEWTRVDLEEHLVLVNEGAFLIVLLDQVSADLRLDLRIDISVERRHPLAVDADILLDHPCDLHLRGSRGVRLLLRASGALDSDKETVEKSTALPQCNPRTGHSVLLICRAFLSMR